MRKLIALFAIWLALHQAAAARDIYVDNVGGEDTDNGSSPQSTGGGIGPYRTIAKALRNADKGDRIILSNTGEPYRESITFQAGRNSGAADEPFIMDGNGAVLDGSMPIAGPWEHFAEDVFRFRPPRLSHQVLFLAGEPAARQRPAPDGKLPKLEPLQWCLFDGYIYFRVEKDKLPYNYPLSCGGHTVGITLYEVRKVVIANVVVQGFQLDGINAHDSAFNVLLVNVTARGNGRSGISVGGASRVRIDTCLVEQNGAAQVRTEGHSVTQIADSEFQGDAPALVQQGGEVERQ